ncbi:MAG: T9SS type A sorting domain-containing protein, partial [Bacteroidia bacterium]|nr:T9SS type A sorting domain-containing protein [Bacteroidia bacterium]
NLKTFDGSVYTLTVCTKDSVLINGCYHNKINLSNSGGFTYYNFVEGILSEVNPINSYWWPGDPQTWTICECHNGQFYYNFDAAQINNFSCYLTCNPSVPCSSPTNVNELVTDIKLFEIHPNPTTSILNIVDEQNQLQNSTIEIKNYLGQTVYSNSFTNQINLSNLSNGMYFLTIQDKENIKTMKVVKE